MAALNTLRTYRKQHVTIEGPDGVYISRELDAISQSVTNLNRYVVPRVAVVADLPAAADNQGEAYMVTDATATTFWSVVAGGGANIVPVKSDGTNWRIG